MLTPKSSRRERDDRDQVPIFASPEREHPWMGRGCVDRATHFSRTSSPESTAADAATLDAATDLLEGLIDDLSTTEASDLMRGEESADEDGENRNKYVFNDLGEAASFNTARPPGPHEVRVTLESKVSYFRPLLKLQDMFRQQMASNTPFQKRMLTQNLLRSLEQRRISSVSLHNSRLNSIGLSDIVILARGHLVPQP